MAQRDVVTRWIVDPSEAEKGAQKAADAVERGVKRISKTSAQHDKETTRIIRGVRKRGDDLKISLDRSRGSLRGFEKGLATASVASGALTTSLSGAAREVLLTGTSLGILGGAVTAVGLGIGFLGRKIFSESKETVRLREVLTEATKSAEERAEGLLSQARQMDRELRKAKGADLLSEDLGKLDKQAEILEKRINRLREERRKAARAQEGGGPLQFIAGYRRLFETSPEELARQEQNLVALLAANRDERLGLLAVVDLTNDSLRETLRMEAEQENRLAAATTEASKFAAEMQNLAARLRLQAAPGEDLGFIDEFIRQLTRARNTGVRNIFADQARALEDQNRLLRESSPLRRSLLAITIDEEAAERRIFELAGNLTDEERSRLQAIIDQNAELRRQEVRAQPFRALAQQGGAILQRSIGDAMVAGVNQNKDQFLQAIEGLAQGMQRILIDAMLEALQVREQATDFFRELFGVAKAATSGSGDAAVAATTSEQVGID